MSTDSAPSDRVRVNPDTRANAPRGLALGTPCQNEHTINKEPDGDRFWITCGDELLAEHTFTDTTDPDTLRLWTDAVLAGHDLACWKQLVREVRDEITNPTAEISGTQNGWVSLVDRMNAALREGRYARG